ncbi:acyl carrier protein [Paenibacillus glucanolyticus]|uniref:acyl carrier protein n=1 Tax=Paenibacillus glucanolyticus TaxID=59843 RepID=UPI0034CDF2BB
MDRIMKGILNCVEEVIQESMDIIINSEDLTELGMNSIKAIELIVKFEIVFGIEFEDEELLVENFTNIEKIHDRVTRKLNVTV